MNKKKLLIFFLALGLLHLCVSTVFYFISIKGFFPSLHNGKGIWNYACDSNAYHREAIKGLEILNDQGLGAWWKYSYHGWWHVLWISFMYKIFGPIPLAMAPLNAVIWALCFLLVFHISLGLIGNEKVNFAVGSIFSLMPSNLMISIQLLKDPFYILGVLLFIQGWIWVGRVKPDLTGGDWKKIYQVFPLITTALGIYLIANIRFYLVTLWATVAIAFYLLSLFKHPSRWVISTAMIVAVLVIAGFLNGRGISDERGGAREMSNTWSFSDWVPNCIESVLSKIDFFAKAGERDVPEAAYFGPVARMVKGPKSAVSVATMA